jgi:hypothetical protein
MLSRHLSRCVVFNRHFVTYIIVQVSEDIVLYSLALCRDAAPSNDVTNFVFSSRSFFCSRYGPKIHFWKINLVYITLFGSTRWRSWLRNCATNRQVAGSIPDGVIGIFRWHYGPGVDSASNRNEYQEYFLAAKGCRCVWLTTLPP